MGLAMIWARLGKVNPLIVLGVRQVRAGPTEVRDEDNSAEVGGGDDDHAPGVAGKGRPPSACRTVPAVAVSACLGQ